MFLSLRPYCEKGVEEAKGAAAAPKAPGERKNDSAAVDAARARYLARKSKKSAGGK